LRVGAELCPGELGPEGVVIGDAEAEGPSGHVEARAWDRVGVDVAAVFDGEGEPVGAVGVPGDLVVVLVLAAPEDRSGKSFILAGKVRTSAKAW
jgi:hypothetical protein